MDSQADTVITDAGRELVCSCIKDDELRAHMFKHMGMADGSIFYFRPTVWKLCPSR